jgi:glycosyltransferase involved in cell wall biosynthesis
MTHASVLIPYYNRKNALRRSLWLLERQDYSSYDVWIVDDGSEDDVQDFCRLPHIHYLRLRPSGSKARSPNMAWWEAYKKCEGDFVILTHPEIMVPKNAISKMINAHNGRRSVPVQYAIPPRAQSRIDVVDWKSSIGNLQRLRGFWGDMGPWGFMNIRAEYWRHHFSFTGQYRLQWDSYGFLPKTETPGGDDSWMLAQEAKRQSFPNPINLEVYHQHHERLMLQDPEGSWEEDRDVSVRIKRMREAN